MRAFSIVALAAGIAVALPACDEQKFTYDEVWLDGEEDTPDNPDNPDQPGEEPTYDFQTMSKNIKVDPSVRYQTIDGFGASDAWLPNVIGQYWTSNRDQIAKWLFSQEIVNGQPQGIGLSTWRFNLGAGTEELGADGGIDDDNANNRMPCFITINPSDYKNKEASTYKYDWNKCPGQRYFMEQAKKYGVESYVFFSNSPLVTLTRNGKGRSNAGANANIKDEYYDDYAEYIATVTEHFVKDGYNISHISPANEPQYNWNGTNQEGSGWKNEQVAKMARELDKALAAKGLNTKISLGEAGHYVCLYEGNDSRENTLDNFYTPGSAAYIGDLPRVDNISAHSYYTDGNWSDMRQVRQNVYNKAAQYGAKIWQTEWSMLVNGPNHYGEHLDGSTTHWDVAQWMAAVIHNDLTVANVTAWHYWTAMSVERWSQMDRFMLINCTPAGGQYSNDFTAEGRVEDFRTLWVLGNYSLFVRPGYQRIDLIMIESENFFGDAWISPDGKKIVCVYTNRQTERGVRLKVGYGAWPGEVESIMKYTTTDTKNLEGTPCSLEFPVVCEPSSVTTVVYTLK